MTLQTEFMKEIEGKARDIRIDKFADDTEIGLLKQRK